jgi:hypothetical protein
LAIDFKVFSSIHQIAILEFHTSTKVSLYQPIQTELIFIFFSLIYLTASIGSIHLLASQSVNNTITFSLPSLLLSNKFAQYKSQSQIAVPCKYS